LLDGGNFRFALRRAKKRFASPLFLPFISSSRKPFSGLLLDLGPRFLGTAAGTESVFQSQLLGHLVLPVQEHVGQQRRDHAALRAASLGITDVSLPHTAQGSLPGASLKLSWAGFHPQGSCEKFRAYVMFAFLLSQASWHNPF
jgi:hypothetical protein